jgi:hypothetical protein
MERGGIMPSEHISRSPIDTPGTILEGEGRKGDPHDPVRSHRLKLTDRCSLSAQGADVSGGERRMSKAGGT